MLLPLAAGALGACAISPQSGAEATLKPTLELRQADGGTVVFQSGQPVPDFGVQPRPRVDLDGLWRFDPAGRLNDTLTFGDRAQTQRLGWSTPGARVGGVRSNRAARRPAR